MLMHLADELRQRDSEMKITRSRHTDEHDNTDHTCMGPSRFYVAIRFKILKSLIKSLKICQKISQIKNFSTVI